MARGDLDPVGSRWHRLRLGWRYGAVFASLLGGCSAPPVPPPATRQVEVPLRDRFAAGEAPSARAVDGWLSTFGDPALRNLVAEALVRNADLRVAAARREEAAALTRKAGAALVPKLDAGAMGQRNDAGVGPPASTAGLGMQVSWELDVWGRLRGQQAAAREDEAVAAADYAFARQSLAASVAKAWFVAVANRRQMKLDESTLAVLEETDRVVGVKYGVGAVRKLDSDLAKANVAQARAALERSRGALGESLRSLEVLLGRYPSAEIEVAASLPGMPGATPAGVPSQLLERRPDLVAADRQVAAAFYRVGSAKAAQLPRVTLSASLGTLLNPSDAIWNLGSNLLVPVFDGGDRKADVQINEARQKQALAAYVKAALNAFAEVETALSNEVVLRRRQTELAAAEAHLAEAARTADVRYRGGDLSIVDLAQVQQQYFRAQSDVLGVEAERLKQRVNLYLALGGSFE